MRFLYLVGALLPLACSGPSNGESSSGSASTGATETGSEPSNSDPADPSGQEEPDHGSEAVVPQETGSEGERAEGADPGADPTATATAPRAAHRSGRANVFFVGHSLVNWHMPHQLAAIAQSLDRQHSWAAHISIGAPIRWIHNNPDRGEGEEPFSALRSGEYDVFVWTEALPLHNHFDGGDTVDYGGRFYDIAVGANPNVQIYLYETWHDRSPRWRRQIDEMRPIWEQAIDQINAAHQGPEMLLIPAGTAMARLYDRIRQGRVPGIRRFDQLFTDLIHLNHTGNYFVACVQYATIYGRSPVGAARNATGRFGSQIEGPSAATARAMQEIAWEVVRQDPRAGVAR